MEHVAPGARVLVVGGSSGIGAATAAHFSAAGAEVLVADVKPPSDHTMSYAACDLRDPSSIDNMLTTAGSGWMSLPMSPGCLVRGPNSTS